VGGPLNRSMLLKHLTVILILIAGVRRVVMRRRRPTRHGCLALAGATLHGSLGHILSVLGPLLMTRIRLEIRRVEEKLGN
jgi:hypothetical protein